MAYRDYPDWQIEAATTLAAQAEECGLDCDETLYLFVAGGLPGGLGEELLQERAKRQAGTTIQIPEQPTAGPSEKDMVIDLTGQSRAPQSS